MILLKKDNKIYKEIDVHTLDPISLDSYKNIIENDKLILCILICNTTRYVYRATDIIEMRYSIMFNTIHVYLLKDPISREEVKDVYYFMSKLNKNDVLCNNKEELCNKREILFNKDEISFNNKKKISSKNIIRIFDYVCNERELFQNEKYKKIILNYEYKEDKVCVYVIIILGIFGLCMMFMLVFRIIVN
ncbi:hypothetical protein NCER_101171 [Vairimorpha ceranae BRL01]|uniref:Uncharacterized protein n=2 Tax=Vairimorpha ceranae TaxID=40302 RepID=C4V9D7_VAIC1|nr:hypothetical protein AAJ76_780004675 [Vairimorpha ceranae]EEQ82168.1 hypothetical protein NCER_101171 [Vairimorpha ceranae BRL01]KAF5141074.1 hypothetical protein G9O61_00g007650 [Vairimorpha ceranae]KKO74376.1 hypothetical protein AAJ76_780004675 [Vairimorpha ceranae]